MRRYETRKLKNKDMDEECYKLRRQVIDILYQFKTIVNLPRITVRITHNSKSGILGVGRTGECIIWIPEEAINMGRSALRHIVCHELGHAVFSKRHDDNCPVMRPYYDEPATQSEIEEFLKRHAS